MNIRIARLIVNQTSKYVFAPGVAKIAQIQNLAGYTLFDPICQYLQWTSQGKIYQHFSLDKSRLEGHHLGELDESSGTLARAGLRPKVLRLINLHDYGYNYGYYYGYNYGFHRKPSGVHQQTRVYHLIEPRSHRKIISWTAGNYGGNTTKSASFSGPLVVEIDISGWCCRGMMRERDIYIYLYDI